MIIPIELDQIQLQILLSQAGGTDPDSVALSFVKSPDTTAGTISATVKTDVKGAQRIERALKKGSK